MKPPTRQELRSRVQQLLDSTLTRRDASAWAMEFLLDENLIIEDDVVDEAVENLAAADLMVSPHKFFYSELDFRDWLADLGPEP